MSDYQMFEVQVSQVEPLTEQVKRFTLVATDGKPLPAFTGGSHIIVQMSDGDNQYSNAYSLLSSPHDTSCYQIAVRLEENSRGGSRFLHQQVKVGDRLTISTPNNLFALIPSARKAVLVSPLSCRTWQSCNTATSTGSYITAREIQKVAHFVMS
ncbi:putative oxidoreductase [Escherichia coli]|nr:putative oxidoreductase [Escherichia coli]